MRNPRDFVKPLAVGAPDPVLEIPVTPSRIIHFFDPSNEKIVGKLPARYVAETADTGIALELVDGFPFSQIYAPPGKDFICFEPMTAPTNAQIWENGKPRSTPRLARTSSALRR